VREHEIDFGQLVAYASGELTDAGAARIEAWLSMVPEAAQHAHRLREVLATMRAAGTDSPPPAAVRRALSAFAEHRAAPLGWVSRARRVLARLVLDTRHPIAVAGFRGAGAGHQLAFRSDVGRLDLQATPRPRAGRDGWRLRGQVALDQEFELGSVVAAPAGETTTTAGVEPDEHGRFILDLPSGRYDLLVDVDCGRQALVAPGIELG